MSKDNSSDRFLFSKTARNEGNENDFETEPSATHFPPPRTPLNSIPDPSQYHRETQDPDFESKDKLGSTRANPRIFATPRVYGRGKAQSEPNSVQTTPVRSVYRVSNVGSTSGNFGVSRAPQYSGARGGSFSRVSRGIPLLNSEQSIEIPHFELVEDPYFWRDHNVQVLIRIRPLNNTEMVSQGYGQCLRQESAQTLVWLGHPEARFTFDHIACETISQEKLFRVAGLPMVDNCMSGYNSCMFAYGQTGSGKTHTMMGEICQMDGKLNEDCGITPRIFEYLFTRISEEEEGRRDERLNYSCKCSFLEIYNEQITDLLEPSSSNLQLREDLKKGVYVENLTEHSVNTVDDVLKLLLQGAANRKIAATYMNSESSRSHSVFTCTIESHWEKDSTTHIRFGRLNLVDLAGSERQKSSGAEGDRLKEAVNINKSLSTLGLVIMSLVDVAHGKHRHVPYRDSRLTFLLQDSLGGNSKTTIIANVSPSICSANETLSTLKFAQRAKLIQNNAKVNEDASGNVTALQRQIQQLQGQLSFLMEHYNVSKPVSNFVPKLQQSNLGHSLEGNMCDDHNTQMAGNRKMVCLEATLVGALRREKLAETAARRLDAEIEQMNRLAQQREEDAQRAKMILRFREEKIKRLELFADGLLSADKYLMEENNILKEEIQLLQGRIDRNPELTRFALENVRLLNQIRLFQEFYKQGEREKLLAEISELRNQLLETLQGNYGMHKFVYGTEQDNDAIKEVEDCKNMNSKLMREVDELREELRKYCHQAAADFLVKYPEELKQTDTCSVVETVSNRSDSGDEMASCNQQEGEVLNYSDKKIGDAFVMRSSCPQEELLHARSLIETMESEQVRLIKELQLMQEENCIYREILSNKDLIDRESVLKLENFCKEKSDFENKREAVDMGNSNDIRSVSLQAKLDKMIKELDEARSLNCQYQEDQVTQLSWKHQTELVCEQVEMETAKTILHLQEEVAALQSELEKRLCYTAEENMRLRDKVAAREDEIRVVSMEWERATLELTSFLIEGSKSLKDASGQIESIACSFPHENVCLGEQVERAAKVCVEKEVTILLLHKSLEDARMLVLEMEQKLKSLKGATVALTEAQQHDNDASIKEAIQLSMLLNSDVNMIDMLENKLTYKEDPCTEAENDANGVFSGENRLSDCAEVFLRNNSEQDISVLKTAISSGVGNQQICEMKAHENGLALDDMKGPLELARVVLLESTDVIYTCCADTEIYLSALQSDVHEASSLYRELVQGFVENIHEMRKNFVELKENCRNCRLQRVEIPSSEEKIPEQENQYFLLQKIRDELSETNDRLNTIRGCIFKLWTTHDSSVRAEDLVEELDTWSAVCSTSGSDPSAESVAPEKSLYGSSSTCCNVYLGEISEQELDLEGSSTSSTDVNELQKSSGLIKSSIHDKSTKLHLKEELKKANDAFNDVNVQFAALFQTTEIGDWSNTGVCFQESPGFVNGNKKHMVSRGFNQHKKLEVSPELQAFELIMREAEAGYYNVRELISHQKISQASSFFTKFEEAHATMKEADVMLNALLKANQNAKELTGVWKQAGEELMVEKEGLIKEIEQLKVFICLKDGETEMLQDQIHYNLQEVENSVSLLEESFLRMQRDVEEMFKVIYSDSLTMAKDILHCFCNSRSSLEDICSETMGQGFAPLRLHQYHVGKSPNLSRDPGFHEARLQERCLVMNTSVSEPTTVVNGVRCVEEGDQSTLSKKLESRESSPADDDLMDENLFLKKELERKEEVLKGLLFDFSLLQESASTIKDMKDESEKLIVVLSQVQQELQMKTNQLNDVLVQNTKLEDRLVDTETALFISDSHLEQAKGTVDILSNQIAELRMLLEDLYLGKSEVEVQLEEQREVVKSLEEEILRINSSSETKLVSSIEDMEDDLKSVTIERDHLREQVGSLQDRLELAYSLVDENEAITVEARQESEACKVYAEQKEEEVKILERSVQELECTVNVLEKKVNEMEEEVEKHKLTRDSLEFELQALKERMLTVENFTEVMGSDNSDVEQQPEDQLSRQLHNKSVELHEAVKRIRLLEEEKAEQSKEMKQCKEYISELVLHAEAQASQYQHKYKTLEDMVRDVKSDEPTLTSAALSSEKTEKSSMRQRGSSSPFRCISSLVQQMNVEKDQELSQARFRIEELEALAASRQKEVCMLNTRLAAAESMTHDVIRDLLGVKLDMTNYANLVDQYQLQKLMEDTHLQAQESIAMEREIHDLRRQMNDLVDERERCISEVYRRQNDVLAAEITVEQLQEREQLLAAQNEMLKVDNSNLKRRIVELDEMVKKLFGTQNVPLQIQQQRKNKENLLKQQDSTDLTRQLAKSEKIISRVNDELAQYRSFERQRQT
ncbi:kinesin-like protein KIN-12C isoform X4 [Rhododendron vialii]|uniref:kinesin-like protein KIN-12C isoform X4 n=1 Tax=Rhododendron vialii TaxID=182163 RepID=UPI00265D9AA0|nr:kinesin-like protein KIN-12C isoform X4 [Rhododendron vialii]